MKYQVRSEPSEAARAAAGNLPEYFVETCRTDKKVAEQDVETLKLFGKNAWIVEVDT